MEPLIGSLLAAGAVAYIVFRNIKKITDGLEKEEEKVFEIYSTFAIKAEEYLREIKKNIENGTFELKEGKSENEIKEKILEAIRELLFFETVGAKKLSKKEAEERLFNILSKIDQELEESLKNGEEIADNLREKLQKDYEKIKNDI